MKNNYNIHVGGGAGISYSTPKVLLNISYFLGDEFTYVHNNYNYYNV